jgi:hypothetical protein
MKYKSPYPLRSALGLCACLLLCASQSGCGATDDGGGGGRGVAQGAGSALCAGITGGEAIIWDLYNGVIRTDPVLPPAIPAPGNLFSHPSAPLLGFFYPPGWTAQTIDGGIHNIGVNLFRDDGLALYRQQLSTVDGVPGPRDVRDQEFTNFVQGFGLANQATTTVCVNEASGDAGGGIIQASSNALVRVGDATVLVAASVTPFPGLPNANVTVRVVAAPTAEFSTRAIDTFLAIDFQMLVGDDRNLFDRDGDGWRDGVDEFPDDPTRH